MTSINVKHNLVYTAERPAPHMLISAMIIDRLSALWGRESIVGEDGSRTYHVRNMFRYHCKHHWLIRITQGEGDFQHVHRKVDSIPHRNPNHLKIKLSRDDTCAS
jgi:hypothetical protein